MLRYIVATILALSGGTLSAVAEPLSHSTIRLIASIEISATGYQYSNETPAPPTSKHGLSERDCLAVAAYHEARGEGVFGQVAVASVMLQRAVVPGRWGDTVCEVMDENNFSFMTSNFDFPAITEMDAWAVALSVADHMVQHGPITDLPNADHYHADYVAPSWRLKMTKVTQIGQHIFYADPISIRRLSRS